jgi:phosphoglycerol transferase MdoB-like AlkP superfamily enzyme
MGNSLQFELHAYPVVLTAAMFAVSMVVSAIVEPVHLPRAVRAAHDPKRSAGGRLRDMLARTAVYALVFAFFFSFSWRPFYAATGCISFFVIFALVSRAKYEFIREPVLFSDLALVIHLFRHKEMFYANWLNLAFWAFALLYVFGVSAAFMVFEPHVLPATHGLAWVAAGIAVAAGPWLLLLLKPIRHEAARIARRLIGGDDIFGLTIRVGAFGAVYYGFLEWLGRRSERSLPAAPSRSPDPVAGKEKPPIVVVWQSESFIDMRHFGVDRIRLPAVDRLRQRAAAWGRMSSIFEGGYTLRTEFSVITGLSPDQIGPDAPHPYLSPSIYSRVSWPTRLRKAGWSTHFVHPYDRTFFFRHRALPKLGFEELIMLDGFEHDTRRDGPYVSDMRLANRVLSLCADTPADAGRFIFAASMENHGPWSPGRLGLSDPVDIYLSILERSDAALDHLARELDGMDRPVWLVFYGDHAPILKAFADPFPDPRTDYLIVPLASAASSTAAPVAPVERPAWALLSDLVAFAGLDGLLQQPPEPRVAAGGRTA